VAGSGGSTSDGAGTGGSSGAGGNDGEPDARKLLLRDEGHSRLHYVDLASPGDNWSVDVPTGRDLQLVGQRRIMVGTDSGYEERSIDGGAFVSAVTSFPGTQTAHRLHNRNTLLAGVDWQGDQGIVLVEVDSGGAEVDRVVYSGFGYVRLVRQTAGGHFLVTADTVVFEGDAEGNVLWSGTLQGHAEPHAWEALPLASGDVLVSAGYAASLQVFTPPNAAPHLVVSGGDPDPAPFFFADVQVMPTGNYVVTNWQGHGTDFGTSGIQLLEYDPAGALVWWWQQDATFVSSLQGVIVLDGLDLDRLEVESAETGMLEPVN
jgi:hypothetical protein